MSDLCVIFPGLWLVHDFGVSMFRLTGPTCISIPTLLVNLGRMPVFFWGGGWTQNVAFSFWSWESRQYTVWATNISPEKKKSQWQRVIFVCATNCTNWIGCSFYVTSCSWSCVWFLNCLYIDSAFAVHVSHNKQANILGAKILTDYSRSVTNHFFPARQTSTSGIEPSELPSAFFLAQKMASQPKKCRNLFIEK